jgi:transcriptional regulator with XRE-family HTH domain
MDDLGNQIIALRRKRGLKQGELARISGLTQARVSDAEAGKIDPRLSSLSSIAEGLQARLVLVPLESMADVDRLIGRKTPVGDPGSIFDDVFIPDPE